MMKNILMSVSAAALLLTAGGCFGRQDVPPHGTRTFEPTVLSFAPCDMDALNKCRSYHGRVSAREASSREEALAEARKNSPKRTVAFADVAFRETVRLRFFIIPIWATTLHSVEATPLVRGPAPP